MLDFLQSGGGHVEPSSSDKTEHNIISKVSGKQRRLLLVEDSVSCALIAVSFLKELAYSYDVAKNGQDALEKFSKGHYSAIIMDVQMPGMDGLETTRRIRRIEETNNMKQTPILATTGNAIQDDRLFCAKAGMNDYIFKPFDLNDLKIKLESMIGLSLKINRSSVFRNDYGSGTESPTLLFDKKIRSVRLINCT